MRRGARRRIAVESRSRLERLCVAGERLERLDRDALDRVVKLAETYVAAYDLPDEPESVFQARIAELMPRSRKAPTEVN
jgi:hypothetical protein